MDKIIKVEEELGMAIINMKDGRKIPANVRTINTYWESGRKDCTVEIEKPLNLYGNIEKLN